MFGTGSIALQLASDGTWPPDEPITIRYNGDCGAPQNEVTVHLDTIGRVTVEIRGQDGSSRCLVSPSIQLEDGAKLRAAFRWCEEDAALAVGGVVVARFPPEEGAADRTQVVRRRIGRDESIQRDLCQRSIEAHAMRRQREVGLQPPPSGGNRPRKRLRTVGENVSALKDRTLALAEMAEAARVGRNHHLVGVASMLRLLACNAGGTHRPLLLRTAGLLDLPLWVFGNPPSIHQPVNGLWPEHADYSMISADDDGELYQMDLEVWLGTVGYCFHGNTKTNNELLKLLGNEDGAHFDPCVSPEVDLWESITSRDSPLRRDILLRTASTIVQIAARLTDTPEAQAAMTA